MGIIDLDNDDDDEDVFDVDDDKLPVLKNTISKKNRPNNGKSVAIGSRSQGGIMKFWAQGESADQEITTKIKRAGSGKQSKKSGPRNTSKITTVGSGLRTQMQKPNSAHRTRPKGMLLFGLEQIPRHSLSKPQLL